VAHLTADQGAHRNHNRRYPLIAAFSLTCPQDESSNSAATNRPWVLSALERAAMNPVEPTTLAPTCETRPKMSATAKPDVAKLRTQTVRDKNSASAVERGHGRARR